MEDSSDSEDEEEEDDTLEVRCDLVEGWRFASWSSGSYCFPVLERHTCTFSSSEVRPINTQLHVCHTMYSQRSNGSYV